MKLRFARTIFASILVALTVSTVHAQESAESAPATESQKNEQTVFRNPTLYIDNYKGNLSIRDERADVGGTVEGNVAIPNGDLYLRKHSVVTGDIALIGKSRLTKEDGAKVKGHVDKFEAPLPPGSPDPSLANEPGVLNADITTRLGTSAEAAPEDDEASPASIAHVFHVSRRGWLEAQIFFIVIGLLITLFALVVAPRASTLAVAAIDSEPIRCLILGLVGMWGLMVINAVNEALFRISIWAPFGIFIAMLSGVIFIFSAILGITYVGGFMASRLGWRAHGIFGRALIGFVTLALLNLIPVLNFGSAFVQMSAFLMGLGGLIVTGFGRGPHWLTHRLARRGEDDLD